MEPMGIYLYEELLAQQALTISLVLVPADRFQRPFLTGLIGAPRPYPLASKDSYFKAFGPKDPII